MGLFELHTNMSQRHKEILDSFAKREEYGNRRRVLEAALELLETSGGGDIEEIVREYEIRKKLIDLYDFVFINRKLIEGLTNALLGEATIESLLENIHKYVVADFKTAQKALNREMGNSFSDMVDTIFFFSKYLHLISGVHVNEDLQQVFAKLNIFKTMPEIPLEDLNALLEASGFTFDLKIEDKNTPIFTITWISPEDYPEVRKQKEKYLDARREALIARVKKRS